MIKLLLILICSQLAEVHQDSNKVTKLPAAPPLLQITKPSAIFQKPEYTQQTTIQMKPRVHTIRNGRLLEYRCPRNGQKCSWVDRGAVVSREIRDGLVWVTIQ